MIEIESSTPTRRVTAYESKPNGAFVTLHCGHSRWIGGMETQPIILPCTMSPCYRPQRYFGRH